MGKDHIPIRGDWKQKNSSCRVGLWAPRGLSLVFFLLLHFQPDEFLILNGADIIGDEIERSAGDIGSGHRMAAIGPGAGIQKVGGGFNRVDQTRMDR